jgi:hypothetical protein
VRVILASAALSAVKIQTADGKAEASADNAETGFCPHQHLSFSQRFIKD